MTDSFQSAASHGLFLDDAIASDAAPAPELPSMIARPDGILVWANITWCGMCGFTAKEDAMGRDLKCIQGPGTDRAELKRMMEAIQAQRPVTTTLCNYDLAGRPFRHTIDVTPIADARGSVTLFRATSRDVVWLGEDASVGRHPVAVACRRRCDGRQTIDMCLASYELHSKTDDGYGFDDEAIKCPRKVPRPLSLPQPSAPTLVVLTQASPPFAVVWASEDWLKLCGFTAPEVVGHNLSLIQGPGTDRTAVARIMAAARAQSMVENVQLVNYTKTKQPFSHVLSMRPVYENGDLAPPTLFRATSTDARSLGYPTGGCLPLESDTSEVTEELEFWGEEVEDFTAGWQDVAVGLEILDLEERIRVAKARRRAEECDAAIVSPRAPCH